MRRLIRFFQRLAVFGLGIFAVWFNVFVVFRITDQRLPWIVALALTYGIAAYVILPRIVRMSLKILQRKSVPSFTLTGDGFPGDPVNLALVGTLAQLRAAFAGAEWTEADPLGLKSSWGMVVAFVLNRPYPAAPFSTLYLFGRGQDVGFNAKSVFHFDVQGSVAKSTRAGIPWLRFIRQRLGARIHFWPFDGWMFLPAGPPSPRSTPACGAGASRARAAPSTSTTPTTSPDGLPLLHRPMPWGGPGGPHPGRSLRPVLTPSERTGGSGGATFVGRAG